MKKLIVLFLAVFLVLPGCKATPTQQDSPQDTGFHGNYGNEMKIPYTVNLDAQYGADSVERDGDHQDSPYFSTLDFYNMESTDTLTILTNFKTQQQTSEWSCGVTSALMVINWYDALGDYNEESLAEFRNNGLEPGATSLRQAIEIFEGVGGFDLYSTFDCVENVSEVFTLGYIQETLAAGKPIMVGWNDWGGHWQVIIGYDTMGTETT
ncbi:MAG: papain-like cysteine protease family protein, partial [Bacillota bacterium]